MRWVVCIAGLSSLLSASVWAAQDYKVMGSQDLPHYWTIAKRGGSLGLPLKKFHASWGCLAIGFSIEGDGVPANVSVLRDRYSGEIDKDLRDELRKAVLGYIARGRYATTAENAAKQPVYTYNVITFQKELDGTLSAVGKGQIARESAHCELEDFANVVASGALAREAEANK